MSYIVEIRTHGLRMISANCLRISALRSHKVYLQDGGM